jgi:hypothetical protein
MRRHWKDLAERAAKAAFSPDQVCEALPYALKRDIMTAPLEAVRDILDGGQQGSLFPEQRIEQLEAVRQDCRGSAAGNVLIDCAIEAVTSGLTGEQAFKLTLENAFEDNARSALRGIEEHYQREASDRSARYVRDRLAEARRQCDFSALAGDLMVSGKPPRGAVPLPRHSGIDEGPRL